MQQNSPKNKIALAGRLRFFEKQPDSWRRWIYIFSTLAGLPTIMGVWYFHQRENLFIRFAYPLLLLAALLWLVGLLSSCVPLYTVERFTLMVVAIFLFGKYVYFFHAFSNLQEVWTEIEAIFWMAVFLFILTYLVFDRYKALGLALGYTAILGAVGSVRLLSFQHPLLLEFARLEARLMAIALLLFVFARAKDELHQTQQEARQVHWLANTDALTQLPNRRQMSALLEHFMNAEQAFGYLLVDIDFFKQVNDTFGHVSGDEILCEIADLLRSQLRDEDVVGRWGGEEFLILVKEENSERSFHLSQRICQLIEEHTFSNGISITISIGGTTRHQRDTEQTLFNRADSALYRAKNSGRNRVEWQHFV